MIDFFLFVALRVTFRLVSKEEIRFISVDFLGGLVFGFFVFSGPPVFSFWCIINVVSGGHTSPVTVKISFIFSLRAPEIGKVLNGL